MGSWNLTVGLFLVSGLVFLALFGPALAPYDPEYQFTGCVRKEILNEGSCRNLWPLSHAQTLEKDGKREKYHFLLGTDHFGRDQISRLIHGARYCLIMSVLAVLLAALIGIPLGMIGGYFRRLEVFVAKGSDILMSFPTILIAIFIVAVLGPSLENAIIAVAMTAVAPFVKLTRAQVLAERSLDYVAAAQTIGDSHFRVLFRHIFPNILAPLFVLASLTLGTAILESAALSFLGLGVQAPTPEWGLMIREGIKTFFGSQNLQFNPWTSLFAGLFIFFNVLGFNLLGDALRDRFDPSLRS